MLVELLGGRLISPFFGSSIYVWGAVIFVFMLGLAIGYLLGGLYSRRNATIPKLAMMLVLAALTSLPMVYLADPLLNWLFDHVEDPRFGSLLSCMWLYFVPSIFSGMVSPLAVRILIGESGTQTSGRSAGFLYFASTVGSSAGTLMTSFYLVLWMEVNTILLGGIAISCTLGLLAVLFNLNRPKAAAA